MSTARLNHHRQFLLPNKRKDREKGFDGLKPPPSKAAKPNVPRAISHSTPNPKPPEPAFNNQLLAGYLAHEFLTRGTLCGRVWDPARSEAAAPAPAEPRQKGKEAEKRVEKDHRYVEVADLLRARGVHLPGVVNPTQLARFLKP